jgi:hypothetical protein
VLKAVKNFGLKQAGAETSKWVKYIWIINL